MQNPTMVGRGAALGLAACVFVSACDDANDEHDGDDIARLTGALTGAFTEDFESLPASTNWTDGSTHGKWLDVYGGYGSVGVEQLAATKVLHLKPATATSADVTHAAMVRSVATFGDLDVQLRMKTVAQLRATPNPWEMGWFAWHYLDDAHFYYVVLKPNGWELGKRDPAYPGGQRFLATGSAPTFPPGAWHRIGVHQVGAAIDVSVDGNPLTSFTDRERPYTSGALGLYTEDAHVHFDDVALQDLSSTSTSTSTSTDAGSDATAAAATRIYGVTVDDVSNLPAITESLRRLPHKPTTRIVFDELVPATDYVDAVKQIGTVSYTMGELLDSFYVKQYSVASYLARADEYLATLGGNVDTWEVGNEVNGEWLGDTASVVAKISGAYDKFKAAGKRTELTLYYNQGCWAKADHEMFTWARANIPDRMKQGLDQVLVSYYEDDCNGLQPDWNAVFNHLASMFPSSQIGMGECGTTNATNKASYVQRYYGMQVDAPRYVGGYFWWYFREDMVPYTSPLWSVLAQAMQ